MVWHPHFLPIFLPIFCYEDFNKELKKKQFSEQPHTHHLRSAVNTLLYCASIYSSVYLTFDGFQTKTQISVSWFLKIQARFSTFQAFHDFWKRPKYPSSNNIEVGAWDSKSSLWSCYSHNHRRARVDPSSFFARSVSITDFSTHSAIIQCCLCANHNWTQSMRTGDISLLYSHNTSPVCTYPSGTLSLKTLWQLITWVSFKLPHSSPVLGHLSDFQCSNILAKPVTISLTPHSGGNLPSPMTPAGRAGLGQGSADSIKGHTVSSSGCVGPGSLSQCPNHYCAKAVTNVAWLRDNKTSFMKTGREQIWPTGCGLLTHDLSC